MIQYLICEMDSLTFLLNTVSVIIGFLLLDVNMSKFNTGYIVCIYLQMHLIPINHLKYNKFVLKSHLWVSWCLFVTTIVTLGQV